MNEARPYKEFPGIPIELWWDDLEAVRRIMEAKGYEDMRNKMRGL